jgi:NitT/TauT family transport system substrate-binding protein
MARSLKHLIAIVATTAAIAAASSAAAAEKVTLAQNLSPISGVALIAEKEGFFAKNGLDVSVKNFTSGKLCLDTVIGGGADIATTAESPTTAAAMAHEPIAFLARMEYSDDEMLASAASGIKSLADLKGKKIAYTAGTGSEVFLATALRDHGLTMKDIHGVNLRPQDMIAALASGSIDAYASWEPFIMNGKRALGAKAVQIDTTGVYSETFNIVTMKKYMETHPKVVRAFLRSLVEAEAWLKAHPSKAITVIAKTVGMKRDQLAPIWHHFVYHVALDQKVVDVLTAHSKWRLATGNHPPGAVMPNWHDVIFSAPLKAVAPDRVTLTGY